MKTRNSSSNGNTSSGNDSAGVSLQADLASLLTDESQHDLKIVCSDNKEIGGSRTLLSLRSPVFRSMLNTATRQAQGNKISVAFTSSVMQIVLYSIYTDSVDRQHFSLNHAVEAYRAAIFFQRPRLIKIIVELIPDNDIPLLSTLINEALVDLPPSPENKNLYQVLMCPFSSRTLKLGDLNKLTTEALKLVLQTTKHLHYHTNEHHILLCIVEWAWANDTIPPSVMNRHAILNKLSDTTVFPENPEVLVKIVNEQQRASLCKMLKLIRVPLICPHRLIHIMMSVDALAEMSEYIIPCEYVAIYSSVRCPPGHPSNYRGKPHAVWAPGHGLVLLDDGTIVKRPCTTTTTTPIPDGNKATAIRNTRSSSVGVPLGVPSMGVNGSFFGAVGNNPSHGINASEELLDTDFLVDGTEAISNPITLGGRTYEWDIIIDSSGVRQTTSADALGIVGESSHNSSNSPDRSSWYLICNGFHTVIAIDERQNKKQKINEAFAAISSPTQRSQYGRVFGPGDIITFHLNGASRTCSISINGTPYPVAFSHLPDKVYPAAKLWPNAKYRLRARF